MARLIKVNNDKDGIDRRGFLECMAWAGSGVLWSMSGGVLRSRTLSQTGDALPASEFSFAQISDSHIGFGKEANPDVTSTLTEAIKKINELPGTPDFLIHTGDLSHLSKPGEFDTLDQVLRSAKPTERFFVPGEHDMLVGNGQAYLERYGKGSRGAGWYSFDHKGVHFVALVNVADLKAGGLGNLGADQLAWLEKDLAGLSTSTPVVMFAHIPLWTVYPEWGWGTEDGAQALSYVKRFGSVSVLNGHIHQVMQKVEGNISFHTACSTAFPQPAPGSAPSPGPLKVPAERLRSVLGVTAVTFMPGRQTLALVDGSLAETKATNAAAEVKIGNFVFTPKSISVHAGTTVTWANQDDMPHNVVNTANKFSSPILDTDETFTFTFDKPGSYPYFCKIHPMMTGTVEVVSL